MTERLDSQSPADKLDDELPGMLAVAKGIAEQTFPHTMDAAIWAAEFVKLNPGADEGLMLSWFANAIMAGYDTAQARATRSAGTPLIVTRGDGVPLPDQAAALQEFKTQARLGHLFKLLQAIVDSDSKQSRSANADMLAADIARLARTPQSASERRAWDADVLKDADRYRWLRDRANDWSLGKIKDDPTQYPDYAPEQLDADIDAAMNATDATADSRVNKC